MDFYSFTNARVRADDLSAPAFGGRRQLRYRQKELLDSWGGRRILMITGITGGMTTVLIGGPANGALTFNTNGETSLHAVGQASLVWTVLFGEARDGSNSLGRSCQYRSLR